MRDWWGVWKQESRWEKARRQVAPGYYRRAEWWNKSLG